MDTKTTFQHIDLEAIAFGRSSQQTLSAKLEHFGFTGDLSTESGRRAAVESLRKTALGLKVLQPETYKAKLQLIAELVRDVQRLDQATPDATQGASDPEVIAANLFAQHITNVLNTVNLFIVKGDPRHWETPPTRTIVEMYKRWIEDLRALTKEECLTVRLAGLEVKGKAQLS